MRALFYCQHLSGAGHWVRTRELAGALAPAHEVHLVDGGRPVPRPPTTAPVHLLPLPRVCRGATGRLVPLDPGRDMAEVGRQRVGALLAAVDRIRPEVLVVEHFPFGKADLSAEILCLIRAVRDLGPRSRVVCSLRDLLPPSRREERPAPGRVRDLLHRHFDLLLVHADPRLCRLEDSLPWAATLDLPVVHTGIVSEKPGTAAGPGGGVVLASAGGAGGEQLLALCIEAWRLLEDRGASGGRVLVVALPLSAGEGERARLLAAAHGAGVRVEPFAASLLPSMLGAELSISQAGYNTCANLLETRTRALLVPDPAMADQELRARLFAERGLARSLSSADLDAGALATAIEAALRSPAPAHDLDLDGARRSRRLLEELVATTRRDRG